MENEKNTTLEAVDYYWTKLTEDLRMDGFKSILRKKNLTDIQIDEFLNIIWASITLEKEMAWERKLLEQSMTEKPPHEQELFSEITNFLNKYEKLPDWLNSSGIEIAEVPEEIFIAHSSRKTGTSTTANERYFALSRGRQLMSIAEKKYQKTLTEPISIAISVALDVEIYGDDLQKSYDAQKNKQKTK